MVPVVKVCTVDGNPVVDQVDHWLLVTGSAERLCRLVAILDRHVRMDVRDIDAKRLEELKQ